MIRVILAALRRHPSQAVAVAVLAALAAAIAAIVPAYLVSAAEVGTVSAVESAPSGLRTVVAQKKEPGTDVARSLRLTTDIARTMLDRPGLRTSTSVRATGAIRTGNQGTLERDIAYRDGFCERLRVTGDCPENDHEIMISNRVAGELGLDVGTEVTYSPHRGSPARFTISGRYQGDDPTDSLLRSEPVFATPGAITLLRNSELSLVIEARATPELFTSVEALRDARAVTLRLNQLVRNDGYQITSSLEALADRVTLNRRVIAAGVPVAGLQLLLLCWFALGLAVRQAGAGWRPDVGLLKLRGVPPGRVTALAVGRSGFPILAGAVAGAVAALALRGFLGTAVGRTSAQPNLAVADGYVLLGGAGAALLAVIGSLAIAFFAERGMLREPVVDLLRRVPARQGGWRAGAVEVLVAALAVAAVYQVRSAPVDDPAAAGLALFVPVLVALVAALTGTRLLVPTAAAAARRAFGVARISTGLALLDLARRPGARRLAALVVTASALLVTATTGWAAAASARTDRAALELGAARVVTVDAESAAHLLTAVRAADPGGHNAMAVVVGRTTSSSDALPVIAVDSPRLAAVAVWPGGGGAGQGIDVRDLAGRLRPATGAAIVAGGGAMELDLTVPDAVPPLQVTIEAQLIDRRGARIIAALGPAGTGRHTVRADTPGCAGGCRLVGFTLTGSREGSAPVVLHRLAQLDPPSTLVDGKGFADLARWRQPLLSRKPWLLISNSGDGLALRVDRVDPRPIDEAPAVSGANQLGSTPDPLTVEVADTPLPLPAVVSGDLAATRRAGGQPAPLLGAGGVPLRQIGTPAALPRVGETGFVVDLEYADRLLVGVDGTREVWLADDAPDSILGRLRAQGLEIVRTDTVAAASDRYAAEGSAAVLRLNLVVALAGLLLAAASVVLVAAVDRPARAGELAALRLQGVPERTVVRSVIGGYTLVACVAAALGALAAFAAHRLSGDRPVFDDSWDLLTPTGPGWLAIGAAGRRSRRGARRRRFARGPGAWPVTSLLLAILAARRAQTLIVLLLALLATAGAVAGPAYQVTAERAVIGAEVATSTPLERSVQISSGPGRWAPRDFSTRIEPQLTVEGFTTVYTAEYNTAARVGDRLAIPRFSFRDDVCAHLTIRAGRCVSGAREVILGRRTAEGLGADVGAEVRFASAVQTPDGWVAGRAWTLLTVVGVYDPVDPGEPYWAGRTYFGGSDRAAPEPVFVAEPTLELVEHDSTSYTADLIPGPDTFSRERIGTLRADLEQLNLRMGGLRGQVTTEIPALLNRIDASRDLVGRVVPIAAVPLIVLCWFIVYLTVAYATEQRRPEFGLFALRGLPLAQRVTLALGPTVVPVLIGAPIGYVLGHFAVAAFADATLPVSTPVPVGTEYLGYAALAVAGALLAGAWAQRRLFRSSVGPLVRRVPPRVRTAGSLTAVLVAVALAAVAVVQLRATGGELTGVSLLGPVLVTVAVALAVAHLLVPVSRRAGERALRRGRLGPALAAMRMARRPGTQRLLAFVTVAVALLSFAEIAASVGADQRTDRAGTELGASRVVAVAPVPAATLLAATRQVDPDGRFAMAAVMVDRRDGPAGPPGLAVDSGRLAAVDDLARGRHDRTGRRRPSVASGRRRPGRRHRNDRAHRRHRDDLDRTTDGPAHARDRDSRRRPAREAGGVLRGAARPRDVHRPAFRLRGRVSPGVDRGPAAGAGRVHGTGRGAPDRAGRPRTGLRRTTRRLVGFGADPARRQARGRAGRRRPDDRCESRQPGIARRPRPPARRAVPAAHRGRRRPGDRRDRPRPAPRTVHSGGSLAAPAAGRVLGCADGPRIPRPDLPQRRRGLQRRGLARPRRPGRRRRPPARRRPGDRRRTQPRRPAGRARPAGPGGRPPVPRRHRCAGAAPRHRRGAPGRRDRPLRPRAGSARPAHPGPTPSRRRGVRPTRLSLGGDRRRRGGCGSGAGGLDSRRPVRAAVRRPRPRRRAALAAAVGRGGSGTGEFRSYWSRPRRYRVLVLVRCGGCDERTGRGVPAGGAHLPRRGR